MLIHGVEMVVHPECPPIFDGISTPHEAIARWGGTPLHGRQRSAVAELRLSSGHFFLKTYRYSGLWRLRTLFIVSRARREYLNLIRLARLGFSVPQALAYGQARTLGFVSESFVMTRAVEEAVSIWTFLYEPRTAAFPFPQGSERRRLIDEFARLLQGAHAAGFFLHTLRSKNVLLTRTDGRYAVHLIDVPFAGIWRWKLFPRAGRVRDLATLLKWSRRLLSRTERMRFARTYGAGRALVRSAQAYQERFYPLDPLPEPS